MAEIINIQPTTLHHHHAAAAAAAAATGGGTNTIIARSESNPKVYDYDIVDIEKKDVVLGGGGGGEEETNNEKDYTQRAQWLRAAVLGANDGLLSTASLMMGVGAVRKDVKTMILTGIAGMVAGACSMAIGEFVSVYAQYDIELAQIKRSSQNTKNKKNSSLLLPNPYYAAFASAIAFSVGALVPLLGAAFVKDYKVRLGVVVAAVSFALILFGALSAVLGKAPLVKSSFRVLIGGWFAMAVTFGLTKLVDHLAI